MHENKLVSTTEIKVRFNEVDSMGVVWHGNYVDYLEDGREDFGEKFGLHYLDFFREGIIVPLVKIDIDYKKSLKYGEKAIIETRFVETDAAKLIFDYTISRSSNFEIIATARSIQVFLNSEMELQLTFPEFFMKWRQKYFGK